MTLVLDMWHAGSSGHYLVRFKGQDTVKVQRPQKKNVVTKWTG